LSQTLILIPAELNSKGEKCSFWSLLTGFVLVLENLESHGNLKFKKSRRGKRGRYMYVLVLESHGKLDFS